MRRVSCTAKTASVRAECCCSGAPAQDSQFLRREKSKVVMVGSLFRSLSSSLGLSQGYETCPSVKDRRLREFLYLVAPVKFWKTAQLAEMSARLLGLATSSCVHVVAVKEVGDLNYHPLISNLLIVSQCSPYCLVLHFSIAARSASCLQRPLLEIVTFTVYGQSATHLIDSIISWLLYSAMRNAYFTNQQIGKDLSAI